MARHPTFSAGALAVPVAGFLLLAAGAFVAAQAGAYLASQILTLQDERGRWEQLRADLDQFQDWYSAPTPAPAKAAR